MAVSPRAGRAGVLLALLAVVLGAGPTAAQDVTARLEKIRSAVASARESELALLAPRHVQRAAEAVREAAARRQRGAADQDVLEALARARHALARARDLEGKARELLSDGLAARQAAVAAGAPEHAPEAWAEAEEKLRSAGRQVEDGDAADARSEASRAAELYRRAERLALERRVLGLAREARKGAAELGARERAPRTWSRADSLLSRAESALREALGQDEGGGRALERARELADRADRAFRRASRIAAQADSARSRAGGVERLLLRYEAALERIADSLAVSGAPPGAPARTADSTLAALARRASAREELRGRADSLRAAVRRALERADSLARRLARVSRRLDTLSADLERRRTREAKLREVQALFAGDRARMLTNGDSLVLRLTGIGFPSGEAEVPDGARPLLVKVQSTIQKFPDARVIVEGHTDSRGDAEQNRTLSRRRAIAVREWLLTRMALSADRITATGHGESQPIASNDSEEGRADNRRIDVVLVLPEL